MTLFLICRMSNQKKNNLFLVLSRAPLIIFAVPGEQYKHHGSTLEGIVIYSNLNIPKLILFYLALTKVR
jgi:hypothetical protein